MIGNFDVEMAIAIVCLVAIVIVLFEEHIKALLRRKADTAYDEEDWKHSNARYHYAGRGGKGYANLELAEAPTIEYNGHATLPLSGLPHPLVDVNINSDDPESDVKVRADAFGVVTDVFLRIDAAGCRYEWDNLFVSNFDDYVDRAMVAAKERVRKEKILEKEIEDEIAGLQLFNTGDKSKEED